MRIELSILRVFGCLLGVALSSVAHSQCADFTTRSGIAVISIPNEREPTMLRISDFYASAATVGTVKVSRTGLNVDIRQTNSVSVNLPTITCRTQVVDLGTLPAGEYSVTLTKTEVTNSFQFPPPFTMTTVRTTSLSFTIGPPKPIPVATHSALALLVFMLAALGAWRLRDA